MTHFSLISDLINLNKALKADRAIGLDERKQRDRGIGKSLQEFRNSPASQLRTWLHQLFPASSMTAGLQGARLYHIVCTILLLAGFIAGWGLASAVLFYDGKQPINIVNAVVVLVLPQMLLLLLWLLSAMPVFSFMLGSIGSVLGFLNPGRLAAQVAGFFGNKDKPGLDILWQSENASIPGPASRWLFSFWSQLFAFSFNAGLLVKAFFLVSFSDLAFVWSTTLDISNATFHQLLTMLSVPWSSFMTNAVPTMELVANSRYYRLDEGVVSDVASTTQQAIVLGQWWPFLIAAIICYGLLPRIITLGISWYRFRHHLRKTLCNLPGAPELLARMNSPLVTTFAKDPEEALNINADSDDSINTASDYKLSCPVIDWSGAGVDKVTIKSGLASLGIEALAYHDAGGRNSTSQDAELVTTLCQSDPAGIAILIKAWEPPMFEFLDFVRAIRQQCADKMPVVILLQGEVASAVSMADRETWHITLSQLGDPNLHIEILGALK